MGMGSAVLGDISFELSEKDGSTLVKLSHHAIGLLPPDAKKNYTEGWQHLLGNRLKSEAEQ